MSPLRAAFVFCWHLALATDCIPELSELRYEIQRLKFERQVDRDALATVKNELAHFRRFQNRQFEQIDDLQRSKSEPDYAQRAVEHELRDISLNLQRLERHLHRRRHRRHRQKRSAGDADLQYDTLVNRVEGLSKELYSIRMFEQQEIPGMHADLALHDYQIRRLMNMSDRMNLEIDRLRKRSQEKTNVVKDAAKQRKVTSEITNMKARLTDLEDYQKWDEFGTQLMQTHLEDFQRNLSEQMAKAAKTDPPLSDTTAVFNIRDILEEGSGEAENPDHLLPTGWPYDIVQELKRFRTQMAKLDAKVKRIQTDTDQRFDKAQSEMTAMEGNVRDLAKRMNRVELSSAEQTAVKDVRSSLRDLEINVAALQHRVKHLENQSQETKNDQDLKELRSQIKTMHYKVERADSVAEVVKKVQVEHFSLIQDFNQDVNEVKTDLLKFGLKLTTLQADFLNSTLYLYRESQKDLRQDYRLARIEVRLEDSEQRFPEIYNQLKQVSHKPGYDLWKDVHTEVVKLTRTIDKHEFEIIRGNRTLKRLIGGLQLLENQLPTDCSMDTSWHAASYESGVYLLKPKHFNRSISVFCDYVNQTGWTVIQRRNDGVTSFNRTWLEYEAGFGQPDGSYWIGNDALHQITAKSDRKYELFIDTWDIFGVNRWVKYDRFRVADRELNYALQLGDFVGGNLSDSLPYHQGLGFSAYDRDLDASSTHCARYYASGWWFSHCHRANLNGNYYVGMVWFDNSTSDWIQLKESVMKIRAFHSV